MFLAIKRADPDNPGRLAEGPAIRLEHLYAFVPNGLRKLKENLRPALSD